MSNKTDAKQQCKVVGKCRKFLLTRQSTFCHVMEWEHFVRFMPVSEMMWL